MDSCGHVHVQSSENFEPPDTQVPSRRGQGVLLPSSGSCQTINQGPFCGLWAILWAFVGDVAVASGPEWGAEVPAVFRSTDAVMRLVVRERVFKELHSALSYGRCCWPGM